MFDSFKSHFLQPCQINLVYRLGKVMSSRSSVSGEAHNGNPKSALVSEGPLEDEVAILDEEKRIRLKVDLRLCTIAGLLCSLNLLDSGIISSASVTSMLSDLGLDQGNRYSVSILIFTVASVCFQLPATIAVRIVGPRIFFTFVTICFGLITLVCSLFFSVTANIRFSGSKTPHCAVLA